MKLAVTDACIFIDLYELQLTSKFFQLELELHTSVDVFNELYEQQQELLKAYQNNGKLFLHSLEEKDREAIKKMGLSAGLSESDKTVLYVAEQLDAMVLSSDKAVRKQAKKRTIEYHGMLWIFDCLVKDGLLSKLEATQKLTKLISTNVVYQNNMDLQKELDTRIKRWAVE